MTESVSAARRAELEGWLAGAPFNAHYRFRVGALGDGTCAVEAGYRHEFERPGGGISGPVLMAAADVAIFLAIATRRGARERWVTVDRVPARGRGRAVHLPGARAAAGPAAGPRGRGVRARGRRAADAPHRDLRARRG